MLFIINNQISSSPVIDLVNENVSADDLRAAIEDYIISHKQKTFINGEPAEVLLVSGLAEAHHQNLAEHLNTAIFRRNDDKAVVKEGTFANYPMKHCWIQSGDLIIDLAIKQFADKQLDAPEILRSLCDCQCFICDNPDNAIYRLYKI
ncbi:hypothetical protein A2482_05325 [Candidatus Falkowbacteria bacterium RIFOXYC2_FULL_48_21]|uniref:Uncharacterized protein n=1 Tax=Candidatus Falkowbacteria bacterium RIFOXYC2_FULL_48_21 TaxID=1798005 RepID=A0A1F5T9G6_9BACT|nr:MAG: hypothetical protein A2482_05325 [Candidatus Falkowbacteria bacterium RIFOXYC2_FULL_48_21]